MAGFLDHIQALNSDGSDEFTVPQCFLSLKADVHCITYILAEFFIAVVCLLFVYQIALWIHVYKYSFRDPRIHVMLACALYLVLDFISSFGTLSSMAYSEAILSMFHYQIFASTFLYYYRKVMKIIPQLKAQWNFSLISMHILISFVLCVLLAMIFLDLQMETIQAWMMLGKSLLFQMLTWMLMMASTSTTHQRTLSFHVTWILMRELLLCTGPK